MVDAFEVGSDKVRFGAVKFSNDAELIFNLQRFFDKDDIKREIRDTGYVGGFTNTYQGLRILRRNCFGPGNGDRPDVSKGVRGK